MENKPNAKMQKRAFNLFCKRCSLDFKADGSRVQFCQKCSEELNIIAKTTCSTCKKIVKERDQNGRGLECECHDNFYKNKMGRGICARCDKLVDNRSVTELCDDCANENSKETIAKNKSAGNCTICDIFSESRDQNGRCKKCSETWAFGHYNKMASSGNCTICGKWNEKRFAARGITCGCNDKYFVNLFETRNLDDNGLKFKICEKCGRETLHNGSICTVCNPESNCFDFIKAWKDPEFIAKMKEVRRIQYENFYNNLINSEIFASSSFNEEPLDINIINSLSKISGVWAIWGINKETNVSECLTVGQTIDIAHEIKWSIRVLANEDLQDLESKDIGSTGRWNFIQSNYTDFEYRIISKDVVSVQERELIEAIYAIQNNSVYWLPSVTQIYINLSSSEYNVENQLYCN